MTLTITDNITINADGTLTGWACAVNDLGVSDPVALRDCAAPRHECPRGFEIAFGCKALEQKRDAINEQLTDACAWSPVLSGW